MTQTITELQAQLRDMEATSRQMLIVGGDLCGNSMRSMVDSTYRILSIAARAELLDLTLKGLLPETSYGRIQRSIDRAMNESMERILVSQDQEMSGP